jgi:hypothetical protein
MQTELEHSYRPFGAAIATVAVVSQAETLPSGLLRYDAQAGQHDDTVMALAMAWHGVVGPRAVPNIHVFNSCTLRPSTIPLQTVRHNPPT